MRPKTRILNKLKAITLLIFLTLLIPSLCFAEKKIKFGVPAWPGVTVKTEVICQVLEKIGYDTEQFIISLPMVFKGLQEGNIDAYVAGWDPLQSSMTDPLVEKGVVERIHVNVNDAISGLCVPNYVWDQGVHTVEDLNKFTEKFKKTIFCIEAGSGMADSLDAAMKKNAANIGDWNVMNSTTAGMLAQVRDMIEKKEWAVFFGWEPHWMKIEFDIKFLQPSPDTGTIASRKSTVYTIVPSGYSKKDPVAYKFFMQFDIKPEVQSRWIYEYGFKETPPEKVAKDWIKDNRQIVARWVKGIKTEDGRPAIKVIYN